MALYSDYVRDDYGAPGYGRPIAGASVTLFTQDGSTQLQQTVTDANGFFSFTATDGFYLIVTEYGDAIERTPVIIGIPPQIKGDAGTPGGNVLSVGLFSDIKIGFTAPSGTGTIQTSGYSTTGSGVALYGKVGSNPNLQGAGSFQGADGQWWKIVLPSGEARLEQFGGKGDSTWNGSTFTAGTDNYQPMLDAIAAITSVTQFTNWPSGPKIIGQRGANYYFSQTINLHKIVSIEGNATATDNFNNECRFFFLGDMDGFVVNGDKTHGTTAVTSGTYGSAAGSRIKGISIFNPTVQSRNCHAIRVRARCTLEDIYGQWLTQSNHGGGNVIYAVAQSGAGGALEGNISGSIFRNITGRAGARVFEIGNKDANCCEIATLQCIDAGLGGYYEHGTLGNNVSGLQVNQCNQSADSGYARGSNGQVYMLISDTANVGGGNDPVAGNVDPSTALPYWESQEDWPGFPAVSAWVSGKAYTYSPAVGLKALAVTSHISNVYTESYKCDMSGTQASHDGGTVSWTRDSANCDARNGRKSSLGYGFQTFLPYGGNGWTGNPYSSFFFGGIGRDWRNGEIDRWGYYADQRGNPKRRYEALGDTITIEGARELSRQTGRYTQTKDGPANTFYTTILSKLMLRDLNNNNPVALFYSYGIPTYGTFGHGTRIINSHYVAGTPSQWTVSAANGGSLSSVAWVANTAYYDYGNIVKNGGNCYINVNSPARIANHAYNLGDMFSYRGKDYKVTTAGTTSATGPAPDGFETSYVDGTCIVQFLNGAVTAGSGGPTGTNASTPVRDGDVWWLYSPDAALVAGPNF